ncbi:MAG: cytochrome c oxidase subunit II [Acetobacteraceae bacterium]|nr:cytochrome c oxidase subunit II [Acetobacteraceae bacterium]
MQLPKRLFAAVFFTVFSLFAELVSRPALAQAPRPWEMDLQPAFSPMKQQIIDLHDLVLVLITVIMLFVGGLLVWVCIRYNEKRNPVPSQTSHHTGLEIAWTVIPVLILVVMAIPSFRLIYYLDRTPEPDMTVKITGHQWYWQYTYPDHGDIDVESRYIHDEDLKPGQLRLLEVDNRMVIPVGKKIRLLSNSADVIHSFFVPALGVQRYAIPGRTIELWMTADKPGVYYGQCNQICGQDHSKMPIAVQAVPETDFKKWVEQQKKAAGNAPANPARMMAAAEPALTTESRR